MRVRMKVSLFGTVAGHDGPVAGAVIDLPREEAERMAKIGQVEFVDEPTPPMPGQREVVATTFGLVWRESA